MRTRRAVLAPLFLLLAAGLAPAFAADPKPAASPLAGTWTWKWQDEKGDTHRHVLEVEGAGSKVAAREEFDDMPAVKVEDLKLEGKSVRFTVRRGERRTEYKGKLEGDDTINGKVTVLVDGQNNEFGWTATRKPVKK